MEPVITVVVPSFRGARYIELLLSHLLPVLDDLCGELVLVDDCSNDGTWEVMKNAAMKHPPVRCLRLGVQSGQQTATLAGCTIARGRWIATLDDDLEHDPVHIKQLLARGEEGFDLVYAVAKTRFVPGAPQEYLRRAGSALFGFAFSLFLRKPWGVKLTSFRVFRTELMSGMLSTRARSIYVSALALRQLPRIASIVVEPGPHVPSRTTFRRLIKTFAQTIFAYGPWGGLHCNPKVNTLLPIAEICEGRS